MSINFPGAYSFILGQEGGYAENPEPTNYGIAQSTAADYGYSGDMHSIPLDLVEHIYQVGFWDHWSLDEIVNAGVAKAIFSIQVNMGPGNAAPVIQAALASLGWTGAQDGDWGPQTRAGVNAMDPSAMCQAIAQAAADYYTNLAAQNPADAGYLNGWLNRAAELANLAAPYATGLLVVVGLVGVVMVAKGLRP
jgi:lysozyme family protein